MIDNLGLSYSEKIKILLEMNSRITQYAIYATYNTQQEDTCYANHQANTHCTSVLESRNGLFVWSNKHRFDD